MDQNNATKDCGMTPETSPKLDNHEKLLKTIKEYKDNGCLLDFVTDDFKNFILFEYKVLLVKKEIGYDVVYRRSSSFLKGRTPLSVSVCNIDEAISLVKNIIEEIGLDLPSSVTKEDETAYKKSIILNKINSHRNTFDSKIYYAYFYNYFLGINQYNTDFENLIYLHENDKLSFYGECIKARKNKDWFELKINNHMLKLFFLTNDYDETYKRYVSGLYNLKLNHKIIDKKINNIKLFGKDIHKEAKYIVYIFSEHFDIMNITFASRFDSSYSNSGGAPASYWHQGYHGREITFHYNYFCPPKSKEDRSSIFHEFGHFLNDTYIDKCKSHVEKENILKSFLIKDYENAFKNVSNLRYHRYRKYYKHVAPPLNILAKKDKKILEDSYSNELFAEMTCELILSKMRKRKGEKRDHKAERLTKMFPHTKYVISQMLKGKGVNKYKRFKSE